MDRPISTKTHGYIDYATGAALFAAPELFRLKEVRRSALAPRVTGAAATAYSALTDYELGLVRTVPMRAHLALDAASGALLAVSPWLLGSARNGRRHWLPHVAVGLGEIVAALSTETKPRRRPPIARRRAVQGALGLALVGAAAGAAFLNRDRLRALVWRRQDHKQLEAPEQAEGPALDEELFTSAGVAATNEPPPQEEDRDAEPTPQMGREL